MYFKYDNTKSGSFCKITKYIKLDKNKFYIGRRNIGVLLNRNKISESLELNEY